LFPDAKFKQEKRKMLITRDDAVAICVGTGFKAAKTWNKARLTKKMQEMATDAAYADFEVDKEIITDEDEADRLNGLLAEMRDSGSEIEVVKELPQDAEEAEEADDESEESEDEDEAEDEEAEEDEDEEESDDEEEEEEEAPKKKSVKGKAKAKASDDEDEDEEKPAKTKKEKKAKKDAGPSAYGTAFAFMCANPDSDFPALQKELVSKKVFKASAAHTAFSSVRKAVKLLRENGHMKKAGKK